MSIRYPSLRVARPWVFPAVPYRYQHKPKDGSYVIDVLLDLVDHHPSIGFWDCYRRILNQGWEWNHKRIYRVYTMLEHNTWLRDKKRLPARAKQSFFQPEEVDQV